MKTILDLSPKDARQFLLKEESYCNFDLPIYFKFQGLLDQVAAKVGEKSINNFYKSIKDKKGKTKPDSPKNYENVNYRFLNNKDGKYAWRPFQLIHPALYVSLVHKITNDTNWNFIISRMNKFRKNPQIQCYSIPIVSESTLSDKAATISNWWESIEQKSIEYAIEFEYVLHTDITDCYGSIYTHSIAWALHNKTSAKIHRDDGTLIGNLIDKHLQCMSYGQTNGIPQGSTLMDLIAEMVLGFADLELSKKINDSYIEEYQIIRYRDDYRIFTNNPQDAELILKFITEILINLNMRLNAPKTFISNNIIKDSIKPDKIFWNLSKKSTRDLQNHLLIIHNLAMEFPNSGSLSKALLKYFERITNLEKIKNNLSVLISILIDITFKNPRTYPISSAILSEFISYFETDEIRNSILERIINKFEKIPNTGHLEIWLQRVTIKFDRKKEYSELLCQKVNDPALEIWNSDWLTDDIKDIIGSVKITDNRLIKKLNDTIEMGEVQLFGSKSEYPYKD